MIEQEIKDFIKSEIENQISNYETLKIFDIKILLKNYTKYLELTKVLQVEIEDLERNYHLSTYNSDGKVQNYNFKNEYEIKRDKIDKLENRYFNYNRIITKIKHCLDILRNDEYYYIINLRYLQGMSVKDIVENKYISFATYNRHHKRLLNEIKSIFNLI